MKKTSKAQLLAALEAMALPRNHVYVVHSSLLKFGLLEGGAAGAMACLEQALGPDATILMPAFTFGYGRSRVWDYYESKAETGALSEYFRKLPGVQRTIHPFHSLAVRGPLAAKFTACAGLSSFGPGSPFELLLEMDAINLALGTEFEGGATFLHHTEEVAQVPYRFYKEFPGSVTDASGAARPGPYKMFVREIGEGYAWDNAWDHVWDDFVADGLVQLNKLEGANLFAFRIQATHNRFLHRLQADPLYCARKTYHP
ncbi:AAC(3) family N-acetyltransferase [Massilia sp. SM-13]|uniref:AAC(3) family N-acetyltransferase n=1 Tax=Pseudoduganella rhizocola TaxID=3382643 RepID=UPI0038B42CB0